MLTALETLPHIPAGHLRVARSGTGTAVDGYGYVYTVDFKGPSTGGTSSLLGNVNQLVVVPLWQGATGSCKDVVGGRPSLDMTTSREGRSSYTYKFFFVGSKLSDEQLLTVSAENTGVCAASVQSSGSVSDVRVAQGTEGGSAEVQTVTTAATATPTVSQCTGCAVSLVKGAGAGATDLLTITVATNTLAITAEDQIRIGTCNPVTVKTVNAGSTYDIKATHDCPVFSGSTKPIDLDMGYYKLSIANFGIAKKLEEGARTFTIVGAPLHGARGDQRPHARESICRRLFLRQDFLPRCHRAATLGW